MKKIIATIALTAASTAAMATDLTASVNRNYATETNAVSLTAGKQFGAVRGEALVSRDITGGNRVTNLGANVGYPLAAVHGVTFTPKVGVNYLNAQNGTSGFGVRAGLEAAYPVTKNVTVVADYGYLRNETALRVRDGNTVGLGLRTGF